MNQNTTQTKMIIEFGGKQHIAEPGSRIIVNQDRSAEEGNMVTAKDLLSGQDINLKIVKKFLGKKIRGLKFKSKSRYTRHYGHRQGLMILEVALSTAKTAKATVTPVAPAKAIKKAVTKKVTAKKPAIKKITKKAKA